ncbi:MAG TPA: ATPase, T2SS/T4P/T4SS family [Dongiaceae bacterium]|nr:ATPase, T2SS/T4P/T4SS family [Dongiaceae bacterium]
MNQLIIQLKTGDKIEGRLARAFRNNDLDVFIDGEGRKLLFSLDEICYIRFLKPLAAITDDESVTVEEVQTITGETFNVSVMTRWRFMKGFIGLLQGGAKPYSTIFFTHTGVRYRQDDRYTGQILLDNGSISNEKIEEALRTQEELRTRRMGEVLAETTDIPHIEIEQTLQAASGKPEIPPEVRVGDILVEAGLVTRDQVEVAFKNQQSGKKLKVGELLIRKGLITEEQLLSALATKFRLRFVDLANLIISEAALGAISEGLANRMQVFPISFDGRTLVVASSAPTDLTVGDGLRFATNCTIEMVVATSRQIAAAISKYYFNREEKIDTLLEAMKGEVETVSVEEEPEESPFVDPDSEIISIVNRLLTDAHKRGASDIHFEPGSGKNPLIVRYRIDGECITAHKIAASYKSAIIARVKILATLDIAERRRPQSGKILLRYQQQMLEYRVETTPLTGGREAAVLRLLTASDPLSLGDLGLMPHNLERFMALLDKPYGIILCVGPTGSGKTTTLHSALRHINTPERKIWTAEDPVEITQAGLCQVQINDRIGFTFADALRSFLRADPDVIMIGEVRDPETAKIAIEASLTGHLVFSTIHTNTATETAVRLIEMGMDPFNFADALIGILAQRLAKKLCNKCKRKVPAKRELYDELVACFEHIAGSRPDFLPSYEDANLMERNGCDRCGGSGYQGRIAIHELMTATPAIKHAIRQSAGGEELRKLALAEGMWTLKMDGIMKVFHGETDMEHVLRVCM